MSNQPLTIRDLMNAREDALDLAIGALCYLILCTLAAQGGGWVGTMSRFLGGCFAGFFGWGAMSYLVLSFQLWRDSE